MKRLITIALCLIPVIALAGCEKRIAESTPSVYSGASVPGETVYFGAYVPGDDSDSVDKVQDADSEVVEIIDWTTIKQATTASALEEFYSDGDNTYYFPSIKSEFIECKLSNGTTMMFTEALKAGKVSVSDLDKYGIQYWIVDKDGNYTNSLDK